MHIIIYYDTDNVASMLRTNSYKTAVAGTLETTQFVEKNSFEKKDFLYLILVCNQTSSSHELKTVLHHSLVPPLLLSSVLQQL